MPTYDVIVWGCGGVGSAAMYQLTRRGVRVLGLDRFPGGHDRGSSHGQTRIIRKAYFEHPDYVPLLQRTYELWFELEEQHNEKLFRQTGLIEIGPPGGTLIPGVLASTRQHSLDVELVPSADAVTRFPGFHFPDDCQVVYEREAGYLPVERCVLAHLDAAKRLGAVHRTGESVLGWQAKGNDIELQTDGNCYSAARLVIAAGAWASQILNHLQILLRVVRKHLHWFANNDARFRVDSGCPVFFYETPAGYYYGFPQIDELGVKVAEHSGGDPVADPLTVDRTLDPAERNRVANFLSTYAPSVSARATDHTVCMYTLTPDHHFIVDRHPEFPQIAVCAGLSGHGFKFAPVLGEILADLVLDGTTRHPIGFLSSQRPALLRREN